MKKPVRSQKLFARASQILPGGVDSPVRAFRSVGATPLFITRGQGARIEDPKACRCGEVLTGQIKPWECGVFGTACTPERPLGTCMVSSEGACAAYYNYGRFAREREVV